MHPNGNERRTIRILVWDHVCPPFGVCNSDSPSVLVGVVSLHFSLVSVRDVASVCNNGMSTRRELTVSRIYGSICCAFQKHASSEVKIIWLPSVIITATTNKPWEKETNKWIEIYQSQATFVTFSLHGSRLLQVYLPERSAEMVDRTQHEKCLQYQRSRVFERPSAVILNCKQIVFHFKNSPRYKVYLRLQQGN